MYTLIRSGPITNSQIA
jgi:hypothetical protein